MPGADQVVAKTLHSLSFGLPSRTAVFQALGRSAPPLMDYERDALVCDLQDQFGGKRAVDKLIATLKHIGHDRSTINLASQTILKNKRSPTRSTDGSLSPSDACFPQSPTKAHQATI